MKNSTLISKSPAKIWTDAFPLGNGRLGAMVYGRVGEEKLQFNEETLWSGYFDENADNPDCAAYLDEIRSLIFAGRLAEAEALANKRFVCRGAGGSDMGSKNKRELPYGSFETAGELFVELGDSDAVGYRRELDLSSGVCRVSYESDGKKHLREYVASEKFSCVCGLIDANSSRIRWRREETPIEYIGDMILVHSRLNGGLEYAIAVKVPGAAVDGDSLVKAGRVELYVSIRTAYTGESDVKSAAIRDVERASEVGFEEIKRESSERVSELMGRCAVDLAPDCSEPFDERLEALRVGDRSWLASLIELYFNFGRYLLISSSRSCVLPANLQGVWTNDYDTIWSADYHININIQMNYWLSEVCRIPECADVFLEYVAFLAEKGKRTAEITYGGMNGWVAHTITNPWGFTAPGNGFSWGSFMCAGAWCCEHLWERWLYSRDEAELAKHYPIMKGSCEFFLDFLTVDPRSGHLVTAPSNSPENHYRDPESGNTVAICAGPTMDNSILYELFENTASAARILGIDADFAAKLDETRAKLPPISVGKHGQIMEWQEDFEETEPGHRHLSMLYGLHPSSQITKSRTPELFEAAKVSIERRLSSGGGHTGWSRAWIINFYARLGIGDECLSHLEALLAKSTYPNMFDSHPPFQIDGNFGGTAGVAEMLLQSHEGFVNLLPALPTEWRDGGFTKLRARGGLLVSATWRDGELVGLEVEAELAGTFELRCGGRSWVVELARGEARVLY